MRGIGGHREKPWHFRHRCGICATVGEGFKRGDTEDAEKEKKDKINYKNTETQRKATINVERLRRDVLT